MNEVETQAKWVLNDMRYCAPEVAAHKMQIWYEAFNALLMDNLDKSHAIENSLLPEFKEIESNYCGCEHGRTCVVHDVIREVEEALAKYFSLKEKVSLKEST